jgi:mutator protein MutT
MRWRGSVELKTVGLKVYYKNKNAPLPTQPLLPGTCAVILNQDGQVLLHKREDNSLWTLPGGKMEIGESISDCCKREIKEELDLNVKTKKLIGIYTSPDCIFDFGKGVVFQSFVVAFLCDANDNNITINNESTTTRWFDKKDLKKLKMIPNTLQIIKHSLKKTPYFD